MNIFVFSAANQAKFGNTQLENKKFKIRCMTSNICTFLALWPHCVSFCRKRMSISWGHSFYLLVLLSSTPLENFGLFSEHPIVMRCCWHPIYLFASTIIVCILYTDRYSRLFLHCWCFCLGARLLRDIPFLIYDIVLKSWLSSENTVQKRG